MTPSPAPPLAFPEPENVASRRRRRRSLMISGGALGVLLLFIAVLYFSPLLPVRNIEVTGNDLLTDQRADELLSDLYGVPMPQVGPGDVRARLGEESVVAEADAHVELPATLHVEITEYPPVAEVHEDDEVMLYNEHGDVIRTFSGPEQLEAEDHATALIDSSSALEDDEIFSTVVAVLGQLPQEARESMESAGADSIDSVQLQLTDGRTVVWGSQERGGEKAAVLQAILASEDEEFTETDVIDISTPGTPVTR